ncbi:MAG: hypothetical protein GYA24_19085 [Candidatus Lokiarchaeota archaeon]|nr:hypothetical protein [Candidatus Lokiarchaeota archaeon]
MPRREELSARLHTDAVARKKAKAKAKHEYDAAHPRVKDICLPEKPVKGYMCGSCLKVPIGDFPGFLCPACQRAFDTHADLF